MTLSVVIPVYNEEENVQLLYEKLREALDPLNRNMKYSLSMMGALTGRFQSSR